MSNEGFKYLLREKGDPKKSPFCCNNIGKSRGKIIFEIVEGQAKMHNKIQRSRQNWLFELAGGSKDQRSISKSLSSLLLPT